MWPVDEKSKVLNIAHRGASGVAPENTISAFKKAIDLGADMIELDVHQSKDGEVVVIHSKKLHHTTSGKGLVEDWTLKELKKFDAGSWFSPEFADEKIPTLREVIELAKGKVGLNIEIKKGRKFYPEIEEKIVKLLEEYDLIEPCIVSSFHIKYTKRIRELNPYIAIGKLLVLSVFSPKEDILMDVNAIHPYWLMVSKRLVEGAHRDHLRVNVWTVNNTNIMRRLIEIGVDGILTNYPERLNWVLSSFKSSHS